MEPLAEKLANGLVSGVSWGFVGFYVFFLKVFFLFRLFDGGFRSKPFQRGDTEEVF